MEKETAKKKPKADYKKMYSEIGKKNGAGIRQAKQETEQKKQWTFAKPLYTSSLLLAYRIAKYMYSQDNAITKFATGEKVGKSYTLTGAQAATNFLDYTCWQDYTAGKYDYIVEEQLKGTVIVSRSGVQSIQAKDIPIHYIPYIIYLLNVELPSAESAESGDIQLSDDGYNLIDSKAKETYFSEILTKYTLLVQSQRESDLYDKGRTSDIFIHKARYGWRDGDTETQRIELTTSAEARELLDTFYKLPQITD